MRRGATAIAGVIIGIAVLSLAVFALYALSFKQRAIAKTLAYIELINERPYIDVLDNKCIVDIGGERLELEIGESRCVASICVICQNGTAIVYRARLIEVS